MATVTSKIVHVLVAKHNAVRAYYHAMKQYTLLGSTCTTALFDSDLKSSIPIDELIKSKDLCQFSNQDVKDGIQRLIELDNIKIVIVDGIEEIVYNSNGD